MVHSVRTYLRAKPNGPMVENCWKISDGQSGAFRPKVALIQRCESGALSGCQWRAAGPTIGLMASVSLRDINHQVSHYGTCAIMGQVRWHAICQQLLGQLVAAHLLMAHSGTCHKPTATSLTMRRLAMSRRLLVRPEMPHLENFMEISPKLAEPR